MLDSIIVAVYFFIIFVAGYFVSRHYRETSAEDRVLLLVDLKETRIARDMLQRMADERRPDLTPEDRYWIYFYLGSASALVGIVKFTGALAEPSRFVTTTLSVDPVGQAPGATSRLGSFRLLMRSASTVQSGCN